MSSRTVLVSRNNDRGDFGFNLVLSHLPFFLAADPGWKIMIVDDESMRVISAAVGMYDIMERKVTLVESIDKKRAPFKDMSAIYVLAPTGESIGAARTSVVQGGVAGLVGRFNVTAFGEEQI